MIYEILESAAHNILVPSILVLTIKHHVKNKVVGSSGGTFLSKGVAN